MSKLWKVRLSGKGGQGLITASIVLADAAIRFGKNAVQTQSYGPESRGGACRGEVIISDQNIYYPKISHPNLLVCMSDTAVKTHAGFLAGDGILIIDETLVTQTRPIKSQFYKVPITGLCREKLGQDIYANMVVLGAIIRITEVVPENVVLETFQDYFSLEMLETNLQAFTIGLKAGEKAIKRFGEFSA
ncbi:MAG: 2-oxoacid:acceptor oxidoreductase family protein [Desulfitobacteriaceae bacterium]|nr:2-oxoacid:acceptor oxidoreductase family protein [Desulfitobacteriaceae bacterium]MDD4753324.1 2-oxoacid:acceptor oxidoreductase family protein [Desulfitobacteriaceae bacterium]